MFLICMLMPASISLLVEKRINKSEKSISDLILKYLFYTFIITTIMNSFIYIFSSEKTLYYADYTFTYNFCLKYMWLSLIVAFALPYILKVISANVDITIEVKEKKKDAKKKDKKKRSIKNNNKRN